MIALRHGHRLGAPSLSNQALAQVSKHALPAGAQDQGRRNASAAVLVAEVLGEVGWVERERATSCLPVEQ
jgi:hypothetical protein